MSETTEDDPIASGEEQGRNTTKKPTKHWRKRPSTWTMVFTGVLTFTTILQYRANKAANDIADIANDTAQRSQRAFVTFTGTSPQIVVDETRKFFVRLNVRARLENTGPTPTSRAFARVNWMPMTNELPKDFSFPDMSESQSRPFPMGPRAVMTMEEAPLSMADISQLNGPIGRYYIWGRVVYRDTFPNTPLRLTEYCIEITNVTFANPSGDVATSNPQVTWTHCPIGNCYDEDCPDYQERVKQGQPESQPQK